jgi:hypothetical protein
MAIPSRQVRGTVIIHTGRRQAKHKTTQKTKQLRRRTHQKRVKGGWEGWGQLMCLRRGSRPLSYKTFAVLHI